MKPEQIERARQILEQLRGLDSMARASYLDDACKDDPEVRNEVELMLVSGLETIGSSLRSPDALRTDRIGAYQVLKKLGHGGMGVVYLARLTGDESAEQVAIKVIKHGMDTDEILRRFRREQKILASFHHPNIARMIEAGTTEDHRSYFVMEYVPGEPLDQHCDRWNLEIPERLKLFRIVCHAVHYAHQNLVVHRDLKPGNILVTPEGVPKLLDFGIAKILTEDATDQSLLTATGLNVMTPDYASPEQVRGDSITTATDIYSLGVLLYQLLSGHLPYRIAGKNLQDAIRVVSETEPERPSVMVTRKEGSISPEQVSERRKSDPEKLKKMMQGDLDQIVLMAMRKEPERRYQSADQLSEDVARYLEQQPIRARKDTFLYRTAKFVRRNKTTVAIFGFSFLAILATVIAVGFVRHKANQQARLFQEFGQDVTRIEAVMRYAYLLPLHDVLPDRKHVLERLDQIQQRMDRLGDLASGPGHYALGRGYLSLHRYQDAQDHLILAWTQHKYREPAVANALGLSLAMLYREKLQEAERLYDRDARKLRKLALAKQYGDSAVQYIQLGKTASASEPPEYSDALLSFLAKRYPEALRKSDFALRKTSWLYEAKVLQGDIFVAMASDLSSAGKGEEARQLFDQAKIRYLEAAQKGQSDPEVYSALCALHSIVQRSFVDQKGTSPDSIIEEGIEYCQKALRANSTNARANVLASTIYSLQAYDQITNGKDYSFSSKQALDYANAALKIDPENGPAYQSIGHLYRNLAWAEIQRMANAISMLELADRNLQKAIIRLPHDYDLMSMLGNTYVDRARFEAYTGKDPGPTLQKAIDTLQKAVDLNQGYFKAYSNLGTAYYAKGAYELDAGLNPQPSLLEAISLFRKTIELNPNYVNAYEYTAVSNLSMAQFVKERGEDPIPHLDQAIASYKKSLELAPDDAYGLAGLAAAYTKKADQLLGMGKVASSELQWAREASENTLKQNNQIMPAYVYFAETELIAARSAMAEGKSPKRFFEDAARILQSGLQISPDCSECWEMSASMHLLRAKYLKSIGQSAKKELQQGLAAASQALRQNPKMARVYAIQGELLLMSAKSSSDQSQLMKAVTSFEQAFKIKASLKRDYGPSYEEARGLKPATQNAD
jgi:serine/threonine protein kinase